MWVSWVWKMEQTEDILVSKSLQCMHCCELVTVALIFLYSLLQMLIAAKNAKMFFI